MKLTKTKISEWLEKYNVKNYTINKDLTVDVDGEVILDYNNLKEIPFKFNIVNGYFSCSGNQLESLNNCPNIVNGNFWCHANKLTSLEGCPTQINGNFICSYNHLTSLEGCPNIIQGDFWCDEYLKETKEYQVHLMMKMLRK